MDYALAKELKEAGYPQKEAPFCVSIIMETDDKENQIRYYMPTLSELIKECGNNFGSLSFVLVNNQGDLKWQAEPAYGISMSVDEGEGDNPEEAVARLWLELNNY